MTKIIIDCYGSDRGPSMVAEGVRLAREKRDFDCVLVGPESIMRTGLKDLTGIEFCDTEEYITNEEAPVMAIRRRKNTSNVIALNRLNEDGDVLLSAGSTGALMAGGYFITKRVPGMKRLCLAVILPNGNQGTLLCDVGASMDTTPQILHQFALAASAYAREVMHIDSPRIGLLNVGTEEEKGDLRSTEAYQLLKNSDLNFVGNVEARELLIPPCDVVISDGFAGNVAIKTMEGTASVLMHVLKKALKSGPLTMLGALLVKKALKQALKDYDYHQYGGAPMLGTRKPIYKAHGNSTAQTFALAISEALNYAESGASQRIFDALASSENHKDGER
ncbi:MAG: phosphate acyltransferase PlsX [Peptoniphilaceae bacterium]|nr:phosphate acyltransferase PlsX [Peptoniphilaceae bacterium]MDY3076050.1 phosphate acyltransferase PlsX [Peptoniphilaceae bacterium]